MSTLSSAPATHSGWQAERSGFMGNLSGLGFVLVATSSLIAVIPIYIRSWTAAFIALPVSALLLLLAFGRVLGLTANEWIVLAVRHQISVATRKNLFFSGVFAPRTKDGRQPMDLPGTLARLHLLEAPDGLGGKIGVMHNPIAGTYTAICRVTFPGLALIDTDRQDSRVAAWEAFLRAQCKEDGAITRISVHQRSLPDDGTALRAWTERHISPDAPAAAVEALDDLMMSAGPAATTRETYLSITLSASRARLAIKGAGGGQVGAAAVLVREIHAMQPAISSASLQIAEWLTPRGVAQVIRTAYDPEAQPALAGRTASAADPEWQGSEPGVDPDLAGPAAAETSWGVYRHDGAWTVSYQVRGLPKSEVYATFLQPLLRPRQNARRSLSLMFEPIGPSKARTELARDKAKRDAARQLRAKTGRAESEDERREAIVAREQDAARAAGHGVLRTTCLLAVTVTALDELETACAELQADASQAGLELRRCWGAQDDAFTIAALPLGQGLPDRRVGI
ncbi:putative integral membrane protein [Streptomyces bingchenggensis BCW-1]|uniref:Putative integral membrane protein n=1 Tax=Streptomyces bingchenggensis (strain BCW-1) TaxID=749414 RepID=D7C147_STRBB|nr:SCO6880 family protein [Streptomyces milbemycinicus]ADI07948.1 putative integral membrane protein [Streptomyces bingchenggensis BCW-1]